MWLLLPVQTFFTVRFALSYISLYQEKLGAQVCLGLEFLQVSADKCELTRTALQSFARTHSQIGRQILQCGGKFSYWWIIIELYIFTWNYLGNQLTLLALLVRRGTPSTLSQFLQFFLLGFIGQLIPAEAEGETLAGGKRQQILARYKCCHFLGIRYNLPC